MPVEGFATVTLPTDWHNALYLEAEKHNRSMGEQIVFELKRLGYKPMPNSELVKKCEEQGIALPRKLQQKAVEAAPAK